MHSLAFFRLYFILYSFELQDQDYTCFGIFIHLWQGNEMCIKPAEFYLYDQEELCFYDIMIKGHAREIVIVLSPS